MLLSQDEVSTHGFWKKKKNIQSWASQETLVVKNLPANAGDVGLFPGLGRPLGGGHGNPLQYSFLENPMDRGAWWATVHGVIKSWTRLSDFTQKR